MADDVQPAEDAGQGAEAEGQSSDNGLYDLDSVPQELREHIEPHLKAIEGNATKKFQEAASYRKQWEPYEQLGVQDYDPEGLEQLFAFADMAQNEDQFREWVGARAEELGLLEGDDDLDTEGLEDLTQEQIQELVSEAVAEKVNPLYDKLTAQEQEQLLAVETQKVDEQMDSILNDNPNLPEGARDAILRFAYSYEDEDVADPIAQGFEDYKNVLGAGEGNLFSKKSSQPKPAEGPGAASTSPEPITTGIPNESFKNAGGMARERLRQSA